MRGSALIRVIFWGFILWLAGYLLGMILFPFVPTAMLGWVITPFGILFTLWVLIKKMKLNTLKEYLITGLVWTLIAVIGDYFGIVKLLDPKDGYYKLDVYLYYTLTFLLPLIVERMRRKSVPNTTK